MRAVPGEAGGEILDADRERQQLDPWPALSEEGKHEMRGRGRDAAANQGRHEAEARNGKAAGESAGNADPDAVKLRDRRDIGFGEAEIDVERVRHHARDEIGKPIKRDEHQDESQHWALARDEIGEGLDEG